MRTLFDVLQANGVSWASYSHDHVSFLLAFTSLRRHLPTRFRSMARFYRHARAGTLPRFSFVEPAYFRGPGRRASDNHPPHDVRFGERLLKDMYEALRGGPGWRRTLLLVTYDEHGGFFDHVPPPQTGVPSPDGIAGEYDGFAFNRLGVRVPAIVVSPWIDRGTGELHSRLRQGMLAVASEGLLRAGRPAMLPACACSCLHRHSLVLLFHSQSSVSLRASPTPPLSLSTRLSQRPPASCLASTRRPTCSQGEMRGLLHSPPSSPNALLHAPTAHVSLSSEPFHPFVVPQCGACPSILTSSFSFLQGGFQGRFSRSLWNHMLLAL